MRGSTWLSVATPGLIPLPTFLFLSLQCYSLYGQCLCCKDPKCFFYVTWFPWSEQFSFSHVHFQNSCHNIINHRPRCTAKRGQLRTPPIIQLSVFLRPGAWEPLGCRLAITYGLLTSVLAVLESTGVSSSSVIYYKRLKGAWCGITHL